MPANKANWVGIGETKLIIDYTFISIILATMNDLRMGTKNDIRPRMISLINAWHSLKLESLDQKLNSVRICWIQDFEKLITILLTSPQ